MGKASFSEIYDIGLRGKTACFVLLNSQSFMNSSCQLFNRVETEAAVCHADAIRGVGMKNSVTATADSPTNPAVRQNATKKIPHLRMVSRGAARRHSTRFHRFGRREQASSRKAA
jgi:hypothetical protein